MTTTAPEQQTLAELHAVARAALAVLHPDAVRVRRATLHLLAETERALGMERSVPCQTERRALDRVRT